MSRHHDVLVLGGGPAGVSAALAAAEQGLDVRLVDENYLAGGHVYRSPPAAFRVRDEAARSPDYQAGERLRDRLAASTVTAAFDQLVWAVAPGFRVDACGPDGVATWRADRLIVAPGTTERVVPFPGWTLPGVVGLAAATILLKSQQVLPGRRTLVAGAGPLLAAVAHGIVKGGGDVVALADLNSRSAWLRRSAALARRPDLVRRGGGWLRTVRRTGTPLLHGHVVTGVTAGADELVATVAPVDASGRPRPSEARTMRANAVAIGHGLTPATEVTRLLAAQHRFDPAAGGWIPMRDADMRTSVPGLFAAGDGAGVSGAAAAGLEGTIAGLAAAHELGRLDADAFRAATRGPRRALRRAARFGSAMAGLMTLPTALVDTIPENTVVCRCEDVTRAELERAIDDGACDVNQLKAWTRCGMGPCQGRLCGEVAATLLARRVGGREAAGAWTPRVPLRPVSLDQVAGEYDYADIGLPGAAPL